MSGIAMGTAGRVLCLALALSVLAPASGFAQTRDLEAAERRQWRADVRSAEQAIAEAQERHRKALDAYQNMRHRRKKRGEAKREIMEELAAAEADIPVKERKLEDLHEAARRAGVPPGWLRDLETPSPPAASP